MLVGGERRSRFRALKQVRVIAALSQLHHNVQQAAAVYAAVDSVHVFLQQRSVPLLLHLRHTDAQDGLRLRWKSLLHLRLDASQQERAEHLVKLRHNLQLRLIRGLSILLHPVHVEPLVEGVRVGEHLGEKEVEQRPQLVQVVLQRRSGEKQAIIGVEQSNGLGKQAVFVLDAVRLVDDEVSPVELLEQVLLLDDHLERGDADVKLSGHHEVVLLVLTFLCVAVELDGSKHGAPPSHLVHPVAESGLGYDDEVWSRNSAVLVQVSEQGDGLQCLSETHLVGEDSVDAVVVQVNHPVESLELVLAHLARHARRLHGESVCGCGDHLVVRLDVAVVVVRGVAAVSRFLLGLFRLFVLFRILDEVREDLRLLEQVLESRL
mmetsp:Transcript_13968/g.34953  ORF Transcript_13968/g.34953 Transcript_13968/m.34953 type:complete len:377 (+) Transcript_13968:1858-2988(+)